MTRPAETTTLHTAMLRLTLAVDDARAYWRVPDLGPPQGRVDRAFAGFWFGARSHARVELLLANLRTRFDAYPETLARLRAGADPSPETRVLICHWHTQLSDPLYRAFTGVYLPQRRAARPETTLDRVATWVDEQAPGRWSPSTRAQFAGKLLGAAHEAGIIATTRDPRTIRVPSVPDEALLYLIHLLRGVEYAGTVLANPYGASVGLVGEELAARLQVLPGVRFRRQGDLVELDL